MPKLKNLRHEAYARARSEGHSSTASARMAGYSSANVRSTASSLSHNPAVQERIAEYQAGTALTPVEAGEVVNEKVKKARAKPDRQYVIDQLMDTAEEAAATMQFNARLKALELIGREMGMFVERTMQITSPLDGLSADQLLKLLAAMEDYERQAAKPVVTITAKAAITAADKSGDGISHTT